MLSFFSLIVPAHLTVLLGKHSCDLRASVSRHGNFNELPSKDQNQKAGECFVISYKKIVEQVECQVSRSV